MNFLKSVWSLVKNNFLAVLFILFVGGIFIVPFLFWAFNKVRSMAPEAVKKVIPAAKPVDAEGAIEKVAPSAAAT